MKPKPFIYLDMDGVICDFIGRVKARYPDSMEWMPDAILWPRIHSIERFWENMPWTKDGKALWKFLKKYKPTILSALTKSDKRVKKGKKEWLAKNLPNVPYILVKKAVLKQKYAKKNIILIDDFEKNIKQWTKAGGISVHHTSTKDTIKQLKKIFKELA